MKTCEKCGHDVITNPEGNIMWHDCKPKTSEVDWKSLALEAGNKLAWAVARMKAPGPIFNFETGESKSWEDDVCETLIKFPGAKIDREALSEKYLSPKERTKLRAKRAREAASKAG